MPDIFGKEVRGGMKNNEGTLRCASCHYTIVRFSGNPDPQCCPGCGIPSRWVPVPETPKDPLICRCGHHYVHHEVAGFIHSFQDPGKRTHCFGCACQKFEADPAEKPKDPLTCRCGHHYIKHRTKHYLRPESGPYACVECECPVFAAETYKSLACFHCGSRIEVPDSKPMPDICSTCRTPNYLWVEVKPDDKPKSVEPTPDQFEWFWSIVKPVLEQELRKVYRLGFSDGKKERG